MNKKAIQEAKDLAFKNANEIVHLAETEKRSMSADEITQVNGFHAEIDANNAQLEVIKKQEQFRAASSMPVVYDIPVQNKEEKDIQKRFSFRKAILATAPNGTALSGIEQEMHQEAQREAKAAGVELTAGGIFVPEMMLRDNVVTPDTDGGHTVASDIVGVDHAYRNYTALNKNGTTFLTGLQGNVKFAPQDGLAISNWKPEVGAADEANVTFTGQTKTPHRLAVQNSISMQLLAQSSIQIEQFIKADLMRSIAESLEMAAINGSGTGDIPLGLLGQLPAENFLSLGVDGGAMTYDNAVGLETLVTNNNAAGPLSFLTNSRVRGSLKTDRVDTGSGRITWSTEAGKDFLTGYEAFISNNVPNDLTKGLGVDLSAIIMGRFSDLVILQWSGIQLTTDVYSKAFEGNINLVINSFFDVHVRRTDSFSASVDVITS